MNDDAPKGPAPHAEDALAEAGANAFARHDHAQCSGHAMAHAEARAQADGLRLTPVRRRVLEILLEAHRAMGAYEVLERLSEEGFGKQPPVAYRALDFLVEQGFAHRIRRLNAFVACLHPDRDHAPVFLICRICDAVAEADGQPVRRALEASAGDIGFTVERTSLEAVGLCPTCAGAAA